MGGFIYSGSAPDGKGAAARAKFMQKVIYGMAMAHRNGLDFSKYSLADKIRVGVLATAGRLISMPVLFKLQRLAAMKDADKRQSAGITVITSRITCM